MGRGDKRSRRGKIFAGSYGKTRPRKRKRHVKAENSANTEAKSKKSK